MEDLHIWQTKFVSCVYTDRLINKIGSLNKQSNNKVDLTEIKKAIYYAKKYHGSQKRDSGEPFYSHPIAVAYLVSDYVFTTNILVTSILHDALEDTSMTKEQIKYIFNSQIADQVEALTRSNQDGQVSAADVIESLWLQGNKELLLVKLFDRIHNMQTIHAKSKEKQHATIAETLLKFLPIAASHSFFHVEQMFAQLCCNTTNNGSNIVHPQHSSLYCEEYSSASPLALAFQSAIQPK